MARKKQGIEIPSLTQGLIQSTDSDVAVKGTLEQAVNMASTPLGRLETRGGTRIMKSFQDDAAHDLSDILTVSPWSQTGAALIGWYATGTQHWLLQYDTDLQTLSRDDDMGTGWTTGPARPIIVEMFERLYICDATKAYASRRVMKVADNSNAPAAIQEDFQTSQSPRDFKPYVIEAFGGVLFAAGHADGQDPATADEPAVLRHSLLGQDPADTIAPGDANPETSPWDVDAWALIGSKGVPITGLKKGGNVLLVAKEGELYRVWGQALAVAGWQFQVEPIDNMYGVGVANAYALDYYQGYWYGFGRGGPFRTDGQSIEQLDASIPTLINNFDGDVEKSWVCAHPDRKVVLFGIPSGSSYPTKIWVFDTIRQQWAGVWDFGTEQMFNCRPVPATPPTGPAADPSVLVLTTVDDTTINVDFTTGDSAAQTEVWVQNVTLSGAYALNQVLAAADENQDVTGLDPYTTYNIKIRHKRNGLYSNFVEGTGYTALAAPNFYAFGSDSTNKETLRVKQNNNHAYNGATDIEIDRAAVSGQADDFASGNSVTSQGGSVEVTLTGDPADDLTIKMYVSVTIDENASEFSTIKLTVKIYFDPDGASGYTLVKTIENTFQTSNISGPPPFETNTATYDPWTETIAKDAAGDVMVTGGKVKIEATTVTLIGGGATGSFILRGGDGAGANPETYNGVGYDVTGAYSLLKTVTSINLGVMSPDENDTTASNGVAYSFRARAKKTGWGGGTNSAYTEDEDNNNANVAAGGETDENLF